MELLIGELRDTAPKDAISDLLHLLLEQTGPLIDLSLDVVGSLVDPFLVTVEAFQDRVEVVGHREMEFRNRECDSAKQKSPIDV